MESRNVINPKKRKGSEDLKHYHDLTSEANEACSRSCESGILPEETNKVMKKVQKLVTRLITWDLHSIASGNYHLFERRFHRNRMKQN